MLISLTITGKLGSLKFRGGCLPYYGLAAVFALVGQLLTFYALHAGEEKTIRLVVIGSIMLVAGDCGDCRAIAWSLTVPRNAALESQAKAVEARRSRSARSAGYAA